MEETFWKTVAEDLRMQRPTLEKHSSGRLRIRSLVYFLIFSPGFACAFWYRVNRVVLRYSSFLAKLLGVSRFYTFSNDISFLAEIGSGLKIAHVSDIVIGAYAKLGKNCTVYNGVTIGAKSFNTPDLKPIIGDNVIIGTGAKVLGDITIGNNVVIGALTFCDRPIPENSVAHGNPMIVRKRE